MRRRQQHGVHQPFLLAAARVDGKEDVGQANELGAAVEDPAYTSDTLRGRLARQTNRERLVQGRASDLVKAS